SIAGSSSSRACASRVKAREQCRSMSSAVFAGPKVSRNVDSAISCSATTSAAAALRTFHIACMLAPAALPPYSVGTAHDSTENGGGGLMHREYVKWDSPILGRPMEMLWFGHSGRPMIWFPTSQGRFHEDEDFGL